MADIKLLLILVFYLVLASTITVLVVQDKEGIDLSTSSAMSHIKFELSDIRETNIINFSDEDMELTGYTAINPSWEITSNGIEKVSDTSFGDEISVILTYTNLNGNNEYINTYFINNVPKEEFSIYLRRPNDYHYLSTVKVSFKPDGIHYENPIPLMPDVAYTSGNYLNNPNLRITTVLNDIDTIRYMKVYINDTLVMQSYDIPDSEGIFGSSSYYGGIGDAGIGFILQKVIGDYSSGNEQTAAAYTGLSFITLLFKLLLFNVPETVNGETILPMWLNVIMIKVPLLAIAGIIVTIIRGN
jgi:uncharacterized membrane protein YhdT